MPIQLDDVTLLQNYLAGVVKRADHHADNVRYVVLPLIGAIVLFKDSDHEIKVLAQNIVMRRGSTQGSALARFNNGTTVPEILDVFERL